MFSLLLLILKQTNQALQKNIQLGEGGGPTDIKWLPSCFQAPGLRANTRPQRSHSAARTAPRLTFSREGPPARSPPGVGAQGTLNLGPLCTLRNSSQGSWTAQLQVGLQLLPVTRDTTALPRCCQGVLLTPAWGQTQECCSLFFMVSPFSPNKGEMIIKFNSLLFLNVSPYSFLGTHFVYFNSWFSELQKLPVTCRTRRPME